MVEQFHYHSKVKCLSPVTCALEKMANGCLKSLAQWLNTCLNHKVKVSSLKAGYLGENDQQIFYIMARWQNICLVI
jgi:hypothetical protein